MREQERNWRRGFWSLIATQFQGAFNEYGLKQLVIFLILAMSHKKDYQEFLDQFQGALDVEYRDLGITAGDTVAFSRGLERMSGTLKNGQKFDTWVRFTECYRKTNGHWLAIHDHISVPVDLESGKAMLSLKP
jgi:hypothetical protein